MTGILRILYTAFTIVFLATTLQANSTIVPVIVDVEASGRGVVEITNLRTQPTLYNIEVLKWAVVDGADEYEDTRLFIVSPPSFKLHPGKSKKVRLGFRGKRGTPSEQTFRLIVAEVPSEVKKAEEGTSTLDVTLRHVLPVYVAPQSPRWAETELDRHEARRHCHPAGHQLRQPAGDRGQRRIASEPQPGQHARICQQQLSTCFGGILAGMASETARRYAARQGGLQTDWVEPNLSAGQS